MSDSTTLQMALMLVGTVTPSIAMAWCLAEIDFFPEPRRVIWTSFLLGIVVVPIVLIAYVPLDLGYHPEDLVSEDGPSITSATAWLGLAAGVAVFALIEELAKLGVFRWYPARSPHFDEPMDGIVYGACVGLGFGAWENIHYVLMNEAPMTALQRAFLCAPGHGLWGAFIGYYVGRALLAKRGVWRWSLLAVGVTTVLHTLWNYSLHSRWILQFHDVAPTWCELIQYTHILIEVGLWYWLARTLIAERAHQLERHRAGEPRAKPPDTFVRRRPWAAAGLALSGALIAGVCVVLVGWIVVGSTLVDTPEFPEGFLAQLLVAIIPVALAGVLLLHTAVRRLRGGPL